MTDTYSMLNPINTYILSLIHKGLSDRQIGKELCINHQYVYRFRRNNNITPGSTYRKKPRKFTPIKPHCEKRLVVGYCLTLPNVYEDYPFAKKKGTAMRHRGNGKTFAFLHEHDGKLYVNLKCEPGEAIRLRKMYKNVIPAYQMNKTTQRYWITVIFGGDVSEQELHDMIQHSYELTKPSPL